MTSIIKIVLDDMRQQHGGDFALKVVEKFDEGVGVTVNTTVSPFVAWREAAVDAAADMAYGLEQDGYTVRKMDPREACQFAAYSDNGMIQVQVIGLSVAPDEVYE